MVVGGGAQWNRNLYFNRKDVILQVENECITADEADAREGNELPSQMLSAGQTKLGPRGGLLIQAASGSKSSLCIQGRVRGTSRAVLAGTALVTPSHCPRNPNAAG